MEQNYNNKVEKEITENKLFSLPTANDAYLQITNSKKKIRDNFPISTQEEIIDKIQRSIENGYTNVIFFNKKITDEDKKVLEDLGYDIDIIVFPLSNMIRTFVSWKK